MALMGRQLSIEWLGFTLVQRRPLTMEIEATASAAVSLGLWGLYICRLKD